MNGPGPCGPNKSRSKSQKKRLGEGLGYATASMFCVMFSKLKLNCIQ